MQHCVRCRVSGTVQGVFFRATTRDRARRLGLRGWVRNLPGGDVEVVACGPEDRIEQLREWLWRGPEQAQVSAVECERISVEAMAGFDIR